VKLGVNSLILDGRSMRRIRVTGEVDTAFWWENTREKVHTPKDLGVDEMILNGS